MRAILPVLLFSFATVAAAAQPSKSAAALADAAAPSVKVFAAKLAVAQWEPRVTELVATYPGAAKAGRKWHAGDPHFDAARSAFLRRIEGWTAELAQAPGATNAVNKGFATLDEAVAKKVAPKISGDTGKLYGEWCDAITAGAEFATANPKMQPGGEEFDRGYTEYMKRLGLTMPAVETPKEILALSESDEGTKYSHARGYAVKSVVLFIDGNLQLAVNDNLGALGEMIGVEVEKCAKAKH